MADLRAVSKWRQEAHTRGLLKNTRSDDGCAAVADSQCGVSLSYLEQLALTVQALRTEFQTPCGTLQVFQDIIKPALFKSSRDATRFWDQVPLRHKGPPSWYVVHTWSGSFLDMVAALLRELAPEPAAGEQPGHRDIKERTMVWLDIFTVQCGVVKDAAAATLDVAEAQATCSQGVILALDRDVTALSSTWCMFELFHAIFRQSCSGIRFALPGGLDIADIVRLHKLCSGVDVMKTECSSAQDKVALLAEMRNSVGMQRTNRQLVESLTHGLYRQLRWSGRPEDQGNLAGLLLERGEYMKLQMLLCSIPCLRSDEKTSQEAREIFKMYATDGRDKLEKSGFIKGLTEVGWSEEDAHKVFREADIFSTGYISAQQFESWWLKDVKHHDESDRMRKQFEFSVQSLVLHVGEMANYMQRLNLRQQAAFFRCRKDTIALSIASGHDQAEDGDCQPDAPKSVQTKLVYRKLPPFAVQGNYVEKLSKVAVYTKAGDHKESLKIMHELILSNVEVLDVDPATLLPPDDASGSYMQTQLLAVYMTTFGHALERQGLKRCAEVEFLTKTAAELWSLTPSQAARQGEAVRGIDTLAGKETIKRELRQQLSIKYGVGSVITDMKVKEADLETSMWMAAMRRKFMEQPRNQSAGLSTSEADDMTTRMFSEALPSLADFRSNLMQRGPSIPRARDDTAVSAAPSAEQLRRRRASCDTDLDGPSWRAGVQTASRSSTRPPNALDLIRRGMHERRSLLCQGPAGEAAPEAGLEAPGAAAGAKSGSLSVGPLEDGALKSGSCAVRAEAAPAARSLLSKRSVRFRAIDGFSEAWEAAPSASAPSNVAPTGGSLGEDGCGSSLDSLTQQLCSISRSTSLRVRALSKMDSKGRAASLMQGDSLCDEDDAAQGDAATCPNISLEEVELERETSPRRGHGGSLLDMSTIASRLSMRKKLQPSQHSILQDLGCIEDAPPSISHAASAASGSIPPGLGEGSERASRHSLEADSHTCVDSLVERSAKSMPAFLASTSMRRPGPRLDPPSPDRRQSGGIKPVLSPHPPAGELQHRALGHQCSRRGKTEPPAGSSSMVRSQPCAQTAPEPDAGQHAHHLDPLHALSLALLPESQQKGRGSINQGGGPAGLVGRIGNLIRSRSRKLSTVIEPRSVDEPKTNPKLQLPII